MVDVIFTDDLKKTFKKIKNKLTKERIIKQTNRMNSVQVSNSFDAEGIGLSSNLASISAIPKWRANSTISDSVYFMIQVLMFMQVNQISIKNQTKLPVPYLESV